MPPVPSWLTDTLWALLGVTWLAWAVCGYLAALQAKKFAKRYDHPQRPQFLEFRPPAAVVVPCKGIEPTLRDNVDAICGQDYPAYRALLVVESEDDPAYPVLADAARSQRAAGRDVEVLVAGLATANEGQKAHNLLAAVEHLRRREVDDEVWAFADSDAVPDAAWLGRLIGPLQQPDKTGVTTGYRWLIPVPRDATPLPPGGAGGGSAAGKMGVAGGSPSPNPSRREGDRDAEDDAAAPFASRFVSVINSSAAMFAARDEQTQAWGGSMAVRRQLAVDRGLADWWRGSLSDDYQITRWCRSLGLRVYFVPKCLVASPIDLGWAGVLDFVYRQYFITRVHAPREYWGAVGVLSIYAVGYLSAVAALIGLLIADPARWLQPATVGATAALLWAAAMNQWRHRWRKRVIRNAFGPAMVQRLRRTLILDRWATPLWLIGNWLLLLRASVGRTMKWRGNVYVLRGPQAVEKRGSEVAR